MWKVIRELDLYAEASAQSDVTWPRVPLDALLTPADDGAAIEGWQRVDYRSQGVRLASGWVQREAVSATDATNPLVEIDRMTFVRACVQKELSSVGSNIYGDFPIVHDYLIALALLESDITNVTKPTDGMNLVGPFQLDLRAWQRFREIGLGFDAVINPSMENPYHQITAVSDITHDNQKTMAQLHTATIGPGTDGELVLDFLNVYHAHLIGPQAAYDCLRAYKDGVADKSIQTILDKHFNAEESAKLISRRQRFLKMGGEVVRVHQFIGSTEQVLNEALTRAKTLVLEHMPEIFPASIASGAPWYDVALSIERRGVSEAASAAEIVGYFRDTDSGITTLEHWCGAFVAHCLAKASEAGNPEFRDSIVPGAAQASKWDGWGQYGLSVSEKFPPKGAIVVLSPAKDTGTSGHVGFLHAREGDFVYLLGGNQDDQVKVSRYRASRIRAIRWNNFPSLLQPVQEGGTTLNPSGVPKGREDMAKLIMRRFAEAEYGRFQQIAAVANAIGESGLDPTKHNTRREDSVGLFQCNRNGGVGTGKSVEFLKNPENNIALIVAECNRVPSFRAADTLEEAVEIFVYKIERPSDKVGDTKKRIAIARTLL